MVSATVLSDNLNILPSFLYKKLFIYVNINNYFLCCCTSITTVFAPKTNKMATTATIDTTSYEKFDVILPGNVYGIQFKTLGETNQPPVLEILTSDTGHKNYILIYVEDGVEKKLFFPERALFSLGVNGFDFNFSIDSEEKKLFQMFSYLGKCVETPESIGTEFSPDQKDMETTIRSRILKPAPEHEERLISIKSCYTNNNHFGTRHLCQRIFFFVEGVLYPFATLELCCNLS